MEELSDLVCGPYHDSIARSTVPGNHRFLYEHITKNAFFKPREEWDKHSRVKGEPGNVNA